MVLNLGVVSPLEGQTTIIYIYMFIGVIYQISDILDIYIKIINSSKVSYEVVTIIILYLESPQHEEVY